MSNDSVEQVTAAATQRIRVLILEDNPSDAELMVNALRRTGFDPQWERVDTEQAFTDQLRTDLDLILSDYALPQFNGIQALQLVRSRGLDVPFILISGSIGEDIAVEAMRSGADDYLLKDRMARLGPAIRQALNQARFRNERLKAVSALRASQERLQLFVEHAPAGIAMLDNDMRYVAASRRWLTDYRLEALDLTGRSHYDVFPEIPERWRDIYRRCLAGAVEKCEEDPFPHADGSVDWVRWEIHPWRRDNGEIGGIMIFAELITERKLQQEKIERLSRIRVLSSGINAAIVRASTRQQLLDDACRIAVDHGGFGIAWIGKLDATTLEITPVAWAGVGREHITRTATIRPDVTAGQGAIGSALRERKPVFVNDITENPTIGGQRRQEAIRRGYRSLIVLPLYTSGDVFGNLTLITKELNFFDDEEVALLAELAGNISYALESIARQEKIERLSRIRAVSSEINKVIVRIHDREALLRETSRIAVEHGKFELVWIALVNEEKRDIRPVAWAGFSAEIAHSLNWTTLNTPGVTLAEALRTRTIAVRNDINIDTPAASLRHEALNRGFRSTVCVPFRVDDSIAAAMILFAPGQGFFDDEELALLNEVSANVSFALQAIEKEEKISRLSRIQAVMSGINAAILHVRDRQELYNEACRIAVDHGKFGIAWIGTLDPQTLDVPPVACSGPGAVEFLRDFKASADSNDVLGSGIVGRAIRTGKPVFSNDGLREPGRRNVAITLGYQSRIALPLHEAGNAAGIIVLFAREPGFFTDDEIGLLTELAGNISFALDHIRKGEALSESEHRLDSILSTLQEVVWSMDPHSGQILYVNAAISQLTRRPAADFLARPRLWMRMIHRGDRAAVRSGVRRLLREGVLTHEFRIVLADGEVRVVESSARVQRDDTGRALRIDGTLGDITERKQAEAALRQLNEELEDKVTMRTADLQRAQREAEEASRAKSSFLAAMSHEIRTPMNGVIGMIDVLHQSSLTGDQVEMVNLIRESAFSLLGIINDILDFSKIEASKLELEQEVTAVAEVVEGVCDMLNGMAQKKEVALTLYTDPAIPAQVLGDALRLRQVLINLVNNAIKFSSGHSRPGRVAVRALLVELTPQQTIVEFRVIDNGIGMDEETQARLFTAFIQADVSTTRRFGGTGLGLAIANNLVELMGGEITAQSVLSEGSTFKVRLPFATLPADRNKAEEAPGVAGLSCIVVGARGGMADDFAVYLEHENALVERVPDLASAGMQSAGRSGLSVWVVDACDEPRSLQHIRAAVPAHADRNIRLVVVLIERGRRRRPRTVSGNLITVDGNALNRKTFLTAVAVAGGRASFEVKAEMPAAGRLVANAPSRDEAIHQNRLILIAEDNETNQKVVVRQLALLGYTADVVGDGREALQRWKSGDYALLLTDLHMPQMDGYELTRAIRAEEKSGEHMPIIALTANALKGEADRCRALGMDDYRTKPSPLAELKSVLDKWMPVIPLSAGDSVSSTLSMATRPNAATAMPVDINALKRLVGDDAAIILDFLHDFRASAARLTGELRAAGAARQMKAVSAAAHKLKSSALAVGAITLGELCAALEDASRVGDSAKLSRLLPRFEAEMAAVDQYLARYEHTGHDA